MSGVAGLLGVHGGVGAARGRWGVLVEGVIWSRGMRHRMLRFTQPQLALTENQGTGISVDWPL